MGDLHRIITDDKIGHNHISQSSTYKIKTNIRLETNLIN